MKTLMLEIRGMHCDGCVDQITSRLHAMPGVGAVLVDLMSRTAEVEIDERKCQARELVLCIQRTGFQVDGYRVAESV